jgi:hypothetical protein
MADILTPLPPLPVDDGDLDAVFQTLVSEITSLDGSLVRPRWQTSIPKQPEPSTDWCAIGIMIVDPSPGPWLSYDSLNLQENYWDHESFDLLASFYGPHSQQNARLLRAGLNVPQNTEPLLPYMIRYVGSGPVRNVPELVNQQWIRRQDISLQFRRKVEMVYGVDYIAISEINLIDDTIVDDVIIVPPGSIVEL